MSHGKCFGVLLLCLATVLSDAAHPSKKTGQLDSTSLVASSPGMATRATANLANDGPDHQPGSHHHQRLQPDRPHPAEQGQREVVNPTHQDSNVSDDCGGMIQEDTTIHSPNYPGPYPPGTVCIWNVVVPSGDDRTVNLRINSFDLGASCDDSGDYLEIQANSGTQKVCGSSNSIHTTMETESRLVSIFFVSRPDNPQVGAGFEMDVYLQDADSLPGNNTCPIDSCQSGFVYVPKQGKCVDIDECTLGPLACDPNARCENTEGSFSCECNPGYEGDGLTCTLVKECQEGWVTYPGAASCYYFSALSSVWSQPLTWDEADAYCKQDNGHLVCVETLSEYNFVTSHWTNVTRVHWLGQIWTGFRASNLSEHYTYTCQHDGSLGLQPKPWMAYFNVTKPNAPNGCAVLLQSMQWAIKPCSEVYPAYCQVVLNPPEACPSGWTDYPSANKKKCVQALDKPMSFTEAQSACSVLAPEATLLTVSTARERANTYTQRSWLDLRKTKQSHEWIFSTGEVVEKGAYQNWIDPDAASGTNYNEFDLCAALAQSELYDYPCTGYAFPFVCENALKTTT